MHTGAWRVCDDDVWSAVFLYEVLGEDVLHVACIEQSVVDAVDLGVDLRVLYRLWYVFYAYHLACSVRHEIGYRASTRVEVVD